MYKKVLKREKYEGTFEWFKAYSKYDEDNLKSALSEWKKNEEPEQPIEETTYLGSMPVMMSQQVIEKEKEMQVSAVDKEESNQF
jgi:hypothetical protein